MSEQQESPLPTSQELRDAAARLTAMEQSNQAEMQGIERLGASIDPAGLAMLRLNTFVEFVFQRLGIPSPEVRQMLIIMFETEFQGKVTEALTEVKAEVRKATLGAGSSMNNSQMREMWRGARNPNGKL